MTRLARSTISVEAALLVLALVEVGCNGPQRGGPTNPAVAQPASASASVSASSTSSPPAPTAVLQRGPWDGAASGDTLALRRLAEMHGGLDLLAVVRSSSRRAPTALRALAHADDAELTLAELAALATAAAGRRHDLLEVILDIVSRRPQPTEPLAPDAVSRCVAELDTLSRDERVALADRALAVSALRALARAGKADPKRITTALDP